MADIVDAGGGSSQCRTTSHTLGGVPWQGFTIRGIGGMIFIESGLAEGRARMRLCQVPNLVTYYLSNTPIHGSNHLSSSIHYKGMQ